MVNRAFKEPGDVVYTQYSNIGTFPIKSGISISRGHIYTMGTGGYLQAVTVSEGVVDLTRGIFQAIADNPVPSSGDGDGERKVQCLTPSSYIVMYAPAGIMEGQQVKLAAPTATSGTNKVEALGESENNIGADYLGRVFKIYTQNPSDGTVKKAADNDTAIVRLGVL